MVCCVVARCKNSSAKTSKCRDGITFHRFPQDMVRRKKWETAVNREAEWSSTEASAVCSEHFDIRDFYNTTSGLRRLSTEAVPKINISVCEEQQPTICTDSIIDVKHTDTEEVIELKHKVRRLEVIANNRKRQINQLWQSKKRMQRKMEQMKTVIEHLIQGKDKWNT